KRRNRLCQLCLYHGFLSERPGISCEATLRNTTEAAGSQQPRVPLPLASTRAPRAGVIHAASLSSSGAGRCLIGVLPLLTAAGDLCDPESLQRLKSQQRSA